MAACFGVLTPQTTCGGLRSGWLLHGGSCKPAVRSLCVRTHAESRSLRLKGYRLLGIRASKLDTDMATNSAASAEEEEKVEVYVDPKRALKEVFTTLNTGKYACKSCGYIYNQSAGDSSYPVPPGTMFNELPSDWACPTCGSAQSMFKSTGVEVAGFAENQKYGLGGNSMTTGQKSLLIYGGLLLGFMFFLSGYLLQ